MTLAQGFAILSQQDTDAPACPAIGTCSKDDPGDDGGFLLGQQAAAGGAVWVDLNTTPGTCQVYRAVVLLGNLRPQYAETIEAVVTAADEAPDRRGTPMRPGAVILDDLREMADPNRLGGQPHRLVDLAGATSYVVLDGMPIEQEMYQEGSESPELTASIRLVLMTLTQNTQ